MLQLSMGQAEEQPEARRYDPELARRIVEHELGELFDLDCDLMPPNVGQRGDDRYVGDTVMITTESDTAAQDFQGLYEEIEKVVSQLAGQTSIGKVLIDVTPTDVEPKYRQEPIDIEGPITLQELTRRRIQVYPKLTERYWDKLDDNMMCRTVLAIIAAKDAAFERRRGFSEAERIRERAWQKRKAEIEALNEERIAAGKKPVSFPPNLLKL